MDRNPQIWIDEVEFTNLVTIFDECMKDSRRAFVFQTSKKENQIFLKGTPLGGHLQMDKGAGIQCFTLWYKHQTFTFCKDQKPRG